MPSTFSQTCYVSLQTGYVSPRVLLMVTASTGGDQLDTSVGLVM